MPMQGLRSLVAFAALALALLLGADDADARAVVADFVVAAARAVGLTAARRDAHRLAARARQLPGGALVRRRLAGGAGDARAASATGSLVSSPSVRTV